MANFFAEIPIENLENFENFKKKKKSAFSRKKGLTFQILCRKIPWKRDKSRLDTLTILTNWLKKVKFWVPLSSKSKSNSTFNFFCQDKPWKFEKKITKIIVRFDERQEGKSCFSMSLKVERGGGGAKFFDLEQII